MRVLRFYGGFVYLSWGVSFTCEGGSITYNFAGDQGGGIYARGAEWMNSSCNLIGNQSPQGAALYLTGVESATLEDHTVTNNLALSGSVLYMTCLLYTSPSPRDQRGSRMPSSA